MTPNLHAERAAACRIIGPERLRRSERAVLPRRSRRVVGCALLLVTMLSSCFYDAESPSIQDARELAAAGDAQAAALVYANITRHPRARDAETALIELTRLRLDSVPQPIAPDSVRRAVSALSRVSATDTVASTRQGSQALMQETVLEWCHELGPHSIEGATAVLALAEGASRSGVRSPDIERVRGLARDTVVRDALRAGPISAMSAYLERPRGPDSVAAMQAILVEVARYPNLLTWHEDLITTAIAYAGGHSVPGATEVAAAYEAVLAAPPTPELSSAVAAGEDALAAYVTRFPNDYLAVVALADQRLAAGDALAAEEALGLLGPVSARTGYITLLTASVADLLGERDRAMDMLRSHVRLGMPRYRRAPAELAVAECGPTNHAEPSDVDSASSAGDAPDAVAVSDAELQRLTRELQSSSTAPRAALLLGVLATATLTEAGDAADSPSGAAMMRTALDAFEEAEPYAGHMAIFHWHLAVLQLLNANTSDGVAYLLQYCGALDADCRPDATALLRAFGLEAQLGPLVAQPPAQRTALPGPHGQPCNGGQVYGWPAPASAGSPGSAGRALLYQRGEALRAAGRCEEAAEPYLRAAEGFVDAGPTDAAASNNAALALFWRHECNGGDWELSRAAELISTARDQRHRSTTVAVNAAAILHRAAAFDTLSRWLSPSALRLSGVETEVLLRALSRGSEGSAVREAYGQHPLLSSARRAVAALRTGEAQRPALIGLRSTQMFVLEDVAGLDELRQEVVDRARISGDGQAGVLMDAWAQRVERDRRVERAQRRVQRLTESTDTLRGEALRSEATGPADAAREALRASELAVNASRLLLADALHRRAAANAAQAGDAHANDPYADMHAALTQLDIIGSPLLQTDELRYALQALVIADTCRADERAGSGAHASVAVHGALRLQALARWDSEFQWCVRTALNADNVMQWLQRQQEPSTSGWILAQLSGDERAISQQVSGATEEPRPLAADAAAIILSEHPEPYLQLLPR